MRSRHISQGLLFCFFIIQATLCKSQDVHFSQFEASPLNLNPANAGAFEGTYRLTTAYKNQWRVIEKAYGTTNSTCDFVINTKEQKNFFGLGLNFYRDVAGLHRLVTNKVDVAGAYHLQVDKGQFLAVGFRAGLGTMSIDQGAFEWQNQYDGESFNSSLSSGESEMDYSNTRIADFGAGVLWHGSDERTQQKVSVGGAIYHLNRNKQEIFSKTERRYMRYTFSATYSTPLGANKSRFFNPSIIASYQGKSFEFVTGALFKLKSGEDSKYTGELESSKFAVGFYYRVGDAIIPTLGFDIKKQLSIRLGYDINTSQLRKASAGRGGVEFSIVFRGDANKDKTIEVVK